MTLVVTGPQAMIMSTHRTVMTMANDSDSSLLSPVDAENLLNRLDDEYAFTILAAILFLAVLMVFGFMGNLLVCIVYIGKFKPSTTRVFIVALALLDLVTCSIAMPGEILDMRRNYSYSSEVMCKVARLTNSFCSIGSGVVLIAVAVDRFKKICRPLQRQITPREAKLAVLYCCLVTLVFAWPAGFLYGYRTVPTGTPDVNGTDCSTADQFLNTAHPLVYNGVLFLVFLVSTTVLTTLYSLIWRRVQHQRDFRSSASAGRLRLQNLSTNSNPGSGDTHSTSVSDEGCPPSTDQSDSVFVVPHQQSDSGLDGDSSVLNYQNELPPSNPDSCDGSVPTPATEVNPRYAPKAESRSWPKLSTSSNKKDLRKNSPSSKQREIRRKTSSQRDSATRKTTFMLFLITLVFILSYLPHLGLMAARAVHRTMMDGLDGPGTALYNLFLRSYFVQSAANPLIYGFCNDKFRAECKLLFQKLLCCKKKK